MDVRAYNRRAWDQKVAEGDRWTRPVDAATIARAREGDWQVVLTPTRPVPRAWFGELAGARLLCLAGAGGQQGPILAAAGARVTVFDNSPAQLAQDAAVARREGLPLATVEGDMADLGAFDEGHFDLIVHPCSNCFVPRLEPVWRECHRVLRPGGRLLAGFVNPLRYLFDDERRENGRLEVRYAIPYSDFDLPEGDRQQLVFDRQQPLEFSHTLTDQIGGQLAAGLVLRGFLEDRYADLATDPLSRYLDTFIATWAEKPAAR